MFENFGKHIADIADVVCSYPLFFLLIGGGLYLFISSGAVSIRRLPASIRELRSKQGHGQHGQISSTQALLSVVAATIGLGNIAGVAIALVVGGPGAIFWMWVSALVGMATKYHEGALAVMYKGKDDQGNPRGGTMHIIEQGLGRKWTPLARFFAIAGMFGTLCIMNANQLTEAFMTTFTTPESVEASSFLSAVGSAVSLSNAQAYRLLFGCAVAVVVSLVIFGGHKAYSQCSQCACAIYGRRILSYGAVHNSHQPACRAVCIRPHFLRGIQPAGRLWRLCRHSYNRSAARSPGQ